jgi:hypothetical protein
MPFPAIMAAAAAMGGEAGLSGLLGQGLLWGAAVPAMGAVTSRLIEGSPEAQMRRQMEIQQEFQNQQTQDMSGLEGLMSRQEAPSLSQLMGEDALFKEVEEASYKLKKARNRRPQYLDELGDIVAGQHARIAALQGERTPSALEIIQMMEGMGG